MPSPATFASLPEEFAAVEALALKPAGSAEELARTFTDIHDILFNLDLDRYDAEEARKAAVPLMQSIFDLRLRLRSQVPEWHARGLMTREAQKALRDAFRMSRYGADMLGELAIGHERLAGNGETYRAFTVPGFNTMLHPDHVMAGDLSFRSGDVLLMRGRRHNSAAIARIGDIDSQFSHVAILYVDGPGRPWVVEALIEEGAVVNPLDAVLKEGLGRSLLFRHKDPDVAHRAAEFIHARVQESRTPGKRPMLYDFTMELKGYDQLFCSKLVRHAYEAGSAGGVVLPTFGTRLDMKNRDFFQRIGVTATDTFAPGDMELEPHFDVVAEWQDYRVTSSLRLQDMIMDKFFEWMDTGGYRFKEDWTARLIAFLGRASSYLSDNAKNLISGVVPKVPVNMSRRAIATIAMLHSTAEPVLKELERVEEERIARTGRPLHPREVRMRLEELRQASNGRIGYLCASVR